MSKNEVIYDIYNTYLKLSKNGKFVNLSAEYQQRIKTVKDDIHEFLDLPIITINKGKRQKEFEEIEIPRLTKPTGIDNEVGYNYPPEPFIEPNTNLPVRMCYPSVGYCKTYSSPSIKRTTSIPSVDTKIVPIIKLPNKKTIIHKSPNPVITSPKKTPQSDDEPKPENIIKYIKNIDVDKLISRKTDGQLGYQSHELREIAKNLGIKAKTNKQEIIDQIKEVIDKYT